MSDESIKSDEYGIIGISSFSSSAASVAASRSVSVFLNNNRITCFVFYFSSPRRAYVRIMMIFFCENLLRVKYKKNCPPKKINKNIYIYNKTKTTANILHTKK